MSAPPPGVPFGPRNLTAYNNVRYVYSADLAPVPPVEPGPGDTPAP